MLHRGVLQCEQCGSTRIRHARAHSPWQRLVVAVTPLQRYACGSCTHRGWRIGGHARAPHPHEPTHVGARPLEERDHHKRARARRRLVRSLLLAILLGALAALMFVV